MGISPVYLALLPVSLSQVHFANTENDQINFVFVITHISHIASKLQNFGSRAFDKRNKFGLFWFLKPIGIKFSITANAFCVIASYINLCTQNC